MSDQQTRFSGRWWGATAGNSYVIDYRMGAEWNARTLAAFVGLLSELRRLVTQAHIVAIPEGGTQAHADPRFAPAIDRYLNARGA